MFTKLNAFSQFSEPLLLTPHEQKGCNGNTGAPTPRRERGRLRRMGVLQAFWKKEARFWALGVEFRPDSTASNGYRAEHRL